MPKDYEVNGTTYSFPDAYDDKKVQEILTKQGVIKQGPQGKQTNPPKNPSEWASRLWETGKGAVKAGLHDFAGAATMFQPGPNPLDKQTQPSNKYQKQGYETTQLAEYAVPLGEEKLIAQAPKGLKLLSRMALDSLRTGTTATAQTGDAKTGFAAGAAAGVFTAAMAGISKAAQLTGRKIQMTTIRPRAVDLKDGFKWETMDKFKLKGNLEDGLRQVDERLLKLRTERNKLIAPGAAKVDLGKVFDDTLAEVTKSAGSLKYGHMGNDAVEGVKAMRADYEKLLGGNLNVDISLAENAKEHAGTLGAWSHGGKDPKASIDEAVANAVYLNAKTEIERSLGTQGPQVKALNKQMQELIPVKHAMLARLPVEERNRLFSLADITAMIPAIATGNAGHLGLLGLTRAQKSLQFGNWLNRMPAAGARASAVGRAAGGATAQAARGVPARDEAPQP